MTYPDMGYRSYYKVTSIIVNANMLCLEKTQMINKTQTNFKFS